MKHTIVPTTKKLLGTLALIGLMSVVLAKFFSDLAFADDQPAATSLVSDAQFMGEYEVKTVVGNTSLEPNQKVWVYRSSDGKFILLNAVNADVGTYVGTDPNVLKGGTIGKTETLTLNPLTTD